MATTTTHPTASASARPGVRAPGRADRGGDPRVRPGGLHGTPVDRIARRVGVAQPYVFSLFGSKRELFLAAVERCFELIDRAVRARRPRSSTRRPRRPDTDVTDGDGERLHASCCDDRPRLPDAAASGVRGLRGRRDPRAGPRLLRAARDPRQASCRTPTPSGSTSSSATARGSTSPRRWESRTCRPGASGSGPSRRTCDELAPLTAAPAGATVRMRAFLFSELSGAMSEDSGGFPRR